MHKLGQYSTQECFNTLFFCLFCSQSYLQEASEMPMGHVLDPSGNYNSPKFRSRNQSYMRAVSTLSQASCVSQVEHQLSFINTYCAGYATALRLARHYGCPLLICKILAVFIIYLHMASKGQNDAEFKKICIYCIYLCIYINHKKGRVAHTSSVVQYLLRTC